MLEELNNDELHFDNKSGLTRSFVCLQEFKIDECETLCERKSYSCLAKQAWVRHALAGFKKTKE